MNFPNYDKELYLSTKIKKRKKDKHIRPKIDWYNQKIFMIFMQLINYQSETLGKFNISPRGHEDNRIVWFFEIDDAKKVIRIFICDLIYHVRANNYLDNIDIKAANGELKRNDYTPFVLFKYEEGKEFNPLDLI